MGGCNRKSSHRNCEGCGRPSRVCLCPALPPARLRTAGQLIVLQHPHEARKQLATVPLLPLCLEGVTVYRGRGYRPESQPVLRRAAEAAAAGACPLYVLFPGRSAVDLRQAASALHQCQQRGRQQREQQGGGAAPARWLEQAGAPAQLSQPGEQQEQREQEQQEGGRTREQLQPLDTRELPPLDTREQPQPLYTLLVIDGTWKQAKEMFASLQPALVQPGGPGVRVQLPLVLLPHSPPQPAEGEAEGCCARLGGAAGEAAGAVAAAGGVEAALLAAEALAAGGGAPAAACDCAEAALLAAAAANGACPQLAAAAHVAAEPGDASAHGMGNGAQLLLRTEPMPGCLSSCEAAARALALLEPPPGGVAVCAAVLRPLALMAAHQARFNPAAAVRQSGEASWFSTARCRMGLSKQTDISQLE
eukprot:scaffold12.g8195.t1